MAIAASPLLQSIESKNKKAAFKAKAAFFEELQNCGYL